MVLNSSPSKRPMGGQPKSEASSWSSAEVRRLWEEPTEAIPQNQREAAGILFLLGRGGCQKIVCNMCVWCVRWLKFHTSRVCPPCAFRFRRTAPQGYKCPSSLRSELKSKAEEW